MYVKPVNNVLFRVGNPEVEPLHVPVGVEVSAQVQLVIRAGDLHRFGEVARLEPGLEQQLVLRPARHARPACRAGPARTATG